MSGGCVTSCQQPPASPRFTSKLVNSRTTHQKPSTGGFLRYLVPVEPQIALPYRLLAGRLRRGPALPGADYNLRQ